MITEKWSDSNSLLWAEYELYVFGASSPRLTWIKVR